MGQKMTRSKFRPPKGEEITRSQFDFQYVIGKGGFGKVWKVIDKKHKTPYALKEMLKVKVIDKKSENSIKYERELLSRLKHPFIVNMYYSFQDSEHLYLVMDLLVGGDLRYHVSRHRRFSEEQTKFFIACILLGLEYIHSQNIIHRDIKPENLVLDEKGFVRITDFGIAKFFSKKNSSETSGTPGYMAPEVMNRQNHTAAVDYFAVGVIGYEFMLGRRPYVGKSRKEIKEQMMAKQAYIKLGDIPDGWSEEAADFFNKLLYRKPEARLGFKGAAEVKDHPWIKYFPWKMLIEKDIDSPFTPEKRDNFDKRYCESVEKIGLETRMRYDQYRNDRNFPILFQYFTYYGIIDESFSETETITSTTPPTRTNGIKNLTTKNTQNTNNNSFNTTLSNPSAPKSSARLRRVSSSLLNVKKQSQPSNHISSSHSSTNFFKYCHNKCKSSTAKIFLQNQMDRSYANKAILNHSRQHHEPFTKLKVNKSANCLSRTPDTRSPNIRRPLSINNIKPTLSRTSTPVNKTTNRSVSPCNMTAICSYAEKNKKMKIFDGTFQNKRPYIKQERESVTSNLLKQIRNNSAMNKKKNVQNVCLKRSNSNYGNFFSKAEIIASSTLKKNPISKPAGHSRYNNINKNYGFIQRNSTKKSTVENFSLNEVKVGDESNKNVNVNVVVINNGIINLNQNHHNKESIKSKTEKMKNIFGKKALKPSNSMNFLFKNYKMNQSSNTSTSTGRGIFDK